MNDDYIKLADEAATYPTDDATANELLWRVAQAIRTLVQENMDLEVILETQRRGFGSQIDKLQRVVDATQNYVNVVQSLKGDSDD